MKNILKNLCLSDILFIALLVYICLTTLYQRNIYTYNTRELIARVPNSVVMDFKHSPAVRAVETPNTYRTIYINIIK